MAKVGKAEFQSQLAGGKNSSDETFWRFKRNHVPGVGTLFEFEQLANFRNGTETTVPLDWNILYREAYQLVIVAKRRELSMKAIENIAPNIAHWSTDSEIGILLDRCSDTYDCEASQDSHLDRLGRRKRIPIKDHVDNLMADRLGLSVETIRSYRERAARRAAMYGPHASGATL